MEYLKTKSGINNNIDNIVGIIPNNKKDVLNNMDDSRIININDLKGLNNVQPKIYGIPTDFFLNNNDNYITTEKRKEIENNILDNNNLTNNGNNNNVNNDKFNMSNIIIYGIMGLLIVVIVKKLRKK